MNGIRERAKAALAEERRLAARDQEERARDISKGIVRAILALPGDEDIVSTVMPYFEWPYGTVVGLRDGEETLHVAIEATSDGYALALCDAAGRRNPNASQIKSLADLGRALEQQWRALR